MKTLWAAAGNWKTTTVAVLAAVTAVLGAASAMLDGDPATNPNWDTTMTAVIVAIGLFFARDADDNPAPPIPGVTIHKPPE